jgi:PAS domain S-box-containing protein
MDAERKILPFDNHQTEALLRTIFSAIKESLFLTDPSGLLVAVNPPGIELSGYGIEELIGIPISDILETHFDAAGRRQEAYIRRKTGERIPVAIHQQNACNGLKTHFIHNLGTPYEDKDLLSSIFRAAPCGIGVVKKRIIIAANDRICEMVGRPRQELLNKEARILYPSDKEYEYVGVEKYRQLSLHGMGTVETCWQHKNGEIINILMSSSPIYPPDLTREITFTALDITERKRAELDREKLQSELLQAQKMESIGRLAGGVAHDFNNMLSVILGHADFASKQVESLNLVQDSLREIKIAAEHSADLTRQLLAFARKQMISPVVLDLNDIISGMLKMLRRIIGANIELSWNPGENLWPIKIDPIQANQIIANLAVNARDAIPGAGEISIKTANVSLNEADCTNQPDSDSGDYVMLTLSDTGQGMTKDVLSHLFEPFFTTKELGNGTGLGLATVYGIVRQNKGWIHVNSEPEQGSSFQIYFPRTAAAVNTEKTETISAHAPAGHGEMVLLVEDESSVLKIVKFMLQKQGYGVLTASNPESALQIVKNYSGNIHLLIMDLILPGMNGNDLAAQIQATRPGLKCIFMTGYASSFIPNEGALESDMNFLAKPFGMNELAEKIRQTLHPDRAGSDPFKDLHNKAI